MPDVQHIYHGEGSPDALGLVAPIGSHFLNDSNGDEFWMATWSDGQSTVWMKVSAVWPPLVTDSDTFTFFETPKTTSRGVLSNGGKVIFQGAGPIYSNVELTTDTHRSYSSATPFDFLVEVGSGGETLFTVTPLTLY